MSWGQLCSKPQLPLDTLLASIAVLGLPGMVLTHGDGTESR